MIRLVVYLAIMAFCAFRVYALIIAFRLASKIEASQKGSVGSKTGAPDIETENQDDNDEKN